MNAGGGGIAGMASCVPRGSSTGQRASTTDSTMPPMISGTPSGGSDPVVVGGDVTSAANDLGLDMEIFAGLGGNIGGGPHEDELTMAALDPMEVDALLSTPDPVNIGSSLSISEAVVMAEERRGDLEEGSSIHHVATAADADASRSESGAGAATLSQEGHGGQQQIGGTGGGTTIERSVMSSGRGEGVITRGSRFASTLAAGMVGAMCLAGVVMNSGTPSVSFFFFIIIFGYIFLRGGGLYS